MASVISQLRDTQLCETRDSESPIDCEVKFTLLLTTPTSPVTEEFGGDKQRTLAAGILFGPKNRREIETAARNCL
jgi:hypothetical protein